MLPEEEMQMTDQSSRPGQQLPQDPIPDRGSDKLIRESLREPVVRLDEQDFERFHQLAAQDGVELLDWTTKGIPAPDVLHGVLQVRPEAARLVLEHFISLRKWYWHDWFPLGIPVPDRFLVRFGNHQELR
jgi:hypothetical protein